MVLQDNNTPLASLLIPLFNNLHSVGLKYCVCGNFHNLPYHTDNDVDIWAKNTTDAVNLVKSTCAAQGYVLYLQNQNATGSNLFFWSARKGLLDIVHLDILAECRWLAFMPLVRSYLIENHREIYNEFFIANSTIDAAMHLMYPLAHHGKIPDKYKNDIIRESSTSDFWKIIETGFGRKFSNNIRPLIGRGEWNFIAKLFSQKKHSIAWHSLRHLCWADISSLFVFIISNISRLIKPNGLFIAFVGPDGCGKTTVQKNLDPFFRKGFTKGKIKKFYWRPFLLPRIRELLGSSHKQSTEDELPPTARLGLRKSSLSVIIVHCLKLLYYWLDFIIGRIKYQGAWSRGGVVCFDRYWDDLIVFPERFGLNVPHGLVRFLAIFIPKPDIVFYLHAEPEVLIGRKPELPQEEMAAQVRQYTHLARSQKNFALIDGTQTEEEVLNSVISTCLSKMAQRYSQNR